MDIVKEFSSIIDAARKSKNPLEKKIALHKLMRNSRNSVLKYIDLGVKILARKKIINCLKKMESMPRVDTTNEDKIQTQGSYITKFMVDAGRLIVISGGIENLFDKSEYETKLLNIIGDMFVIAYQKYKDGFLDFKDGN